jgi:hypothetical protein
MSGSANLGVSGVIFVGLLTCVALAVATVAAVSYAKLIVWMWGVL